MNILRTNFLVLLGTVLLISCGHDDVSSSLSETSSAKPSVSDLGSLVGTYDLAKGDLECAKILFISGDATDKNSITVLGKDAQNKQAGGKEIFADVGGKGTYSYNSSNWQWTWTKVSVEKDSLVLWEARSYFVRPARIFAKEVSRLTVGEGSIVFSGSMYSSERGGPKKYKCHYRY